MTGCCPIHLDEFEINPGCISSHDDRGPSSSKSIVTTMNLSRLRRSINDLEAVAPRLSRLRLYRHCLGSFLLRRRIGINDWPTSDGSDPGSSDVCNVGRIKSLARVPATWIKLGPMQSPPSNICSRLLISSSSVIDGISPLNITSIGGGLHIDCLNTEIPLLSLPSATPVCGH